MKYQKGKTSLLKHKAFGWCNFVTLIKSQKGKTSLLKIIAFACRFRHRQLPVFCSSEQINPHWWLWSLFQFWKIVTPSCFYPQVEYIFQIADFIFLDALKLFLFTSCVYFPDCCVDISWSWDHTFMRYRESMRSMWITTTLSSSAASSSFSFLR